MRLPFLSDSCSCSKPKKQSKTLQQLHDDIEVQRAKLKLIVEQKETELHLKKLEGKQAVTRVSNSANVEIKKYDSLHDIEAAKNDVKEQLREEGRTGWDRLLDSPAAQAILTSLSENLNRRVNNSVNESTNNHMKNVKERAITVQKENYIG